MGRIVPNGVARSSGESFGHVFVNDFVRKSLMAAAVATKSVLAA